MRAEQEVENIERYNQKGRDLKVYRQEWYKQQEVGICLKKRRYSSSLRTEKGGWQFVLAIVRNKPLKTMSMKTNPFIISNESAGQQGGFTGPDLANLVLQVVCIVSVFGWGIDEGLTAQGWSWLGHFSSAACTLILLDWASFQGCGRVPKKKKKKKVETHKNFFKPSQKSHSQVQGHKGRGLQSCRAKGVEKRSH